MSEIIPVTQQSWESVSTKPGYMPPPGTGPAVWSASNSPLTGGPYWTIANTLKPYGKPRAGQIVEWPDGRKFIGCVVPTALTGATGVLGTTPQGAAATGCTAGHGQLVAIESASASSAYPQAVAVANSTGTPTTGTYRVGIAMSNVTAADVTAGNNVIWVQFDGPGWALTDSHSTAIVAGDYLKLGNYTYPSGTYNTVELVHNAAAGVGPLASSTALNVNVAVAVDAGTTASDLISYPNLRQVILLNVLMSV